MAVRIFKEDRDKYQRLKQQSAKDELHEVEKDKYESDVYGMRAHKQLGLTYAFARLFSESITIYKELIQLMAENKADIFGEAYLDLVDVFVWSGRTAEGIETYNGMIREQPSNTWAHYALGVLYTEIGEKGLALQEYKYLKEVKSSFSDQLFKRIYK